MRNEMKITKLFILDSIFWSTPSLNVDFAYRKTFIITLNQKRNHCPHYKAFLSLTKSKPNNYKTNSHETHS